MRDLNIIPPKSSIPKNYRTTPIEYKVEIIDFRNVQNTKDVGLNADNADLMYFEFIDILIENVLFDIADSTLQLVQNRTTERYLITLSKIRALQGRYIEAAKPLDSVLKTDPKNYQAWLLRGHAYFLNGNLFDSEESYIKALRLKPTAKDPVLQERLGLVYIRRKAWKDAKIVFLKCCKSADFLPSTTAWLNLGLSCLRLGELQAAEDAISQANILDHLNPRPWGLMSILCLQYGKDRNVQAEQCFRKAISLGLIDKDILEEIGDLYARDDITMKVSQLAYETLVQVDKENGDGWWKLANVYSSDDSNKVEAIDAYK